MHVPGEIIKTEEAKEWAVDESAAVREGGIFDFGLRIEEAAKGDDQWGRAGEGWGEVCEGGAGIDQIKWGGVGVAGRFVAIWEPQRHAYEYVSMAPMSGASVSRVI